MTFNFYRFARSFVAAVTGVLLLAMAAQAHETHGKPQYGGVVAEAAAFQAELVVKQNAATIYLTDHGKVVSTKGVTGKLIALSEGKTYNADLTPNATTTQLVAALPTPMKTGKFVAQITLPGKPAVSVRFELK